MIVNLQFVVEFSFRFDIPKPEIRRTFGFAAMIYWIMFRIGSLPMKKLQCIFRCTQRHMEA